MNYIYLSQSSILKSLNDNLQRVRTGRVSPAIIEPIKVEAYGTMLSMMELATISSPEPRTIIISPFDKSMIRVISKAIEEAKIGVNPTDNGAGVILNFPPMTEENRKDQVKIIDRIQEEIKIQVRQQRQDILSKNEREFEAQNASEDSVKSFKAQLQKEVDAINQEIEEACKTKAVEVMKI